MLLRYLTGPFGSLGVLQNRELFLALVRERWVCRRMHREMWCERPQCTIVYCVYFYSKYLLYIFITFIRGNVHLYMVHPNSSFPIPSAPFSLSFPSYLQKHCSIFFHFILFFFPFPFLCFFLPLPLFSFPVEHFLPTSNTYHSPWSLVMLLVSHRKKSNVTLKHICLICFI